MAESIAIRIEHVDEGQTVQRLEDIELGLGRRPPRHKFGLSRGMSGGSVEQLLPAEGKLPSLKESIRSTIGESKGLLGTIFSGMIGFVSVTKVFWIVCLYTLFGANLFMWLEVSADLETKKEAYAYHLVARDSLLFKVQQVHEGSHVEKTQHWKQAIMEFEQALDCGLPVEVDSSQWTFWMSVLYCATIYTTVGYGNIACATTGGRVATIVYAICGIPLMIVVLDQLGTFLLKKMKQISNFVDDVMFFLGVRYHLVRVDNQEAFLRYIAICRQLAMLRLIPNTITLTVTEQEEEEADSSHQDSSSSSAISGQSNESAVTVGREKPLLRRKRQDRAERRSLKIALSRGSLLDNLEPFQIESIVDPQSELARKLLLSPPSGPSRMSRRSSCTSKATIHFKLDEADELLRRASPSKISQKTSATGSVGTITVADDEKAGEEAAQQKSSEPPVWKRRRSPPLLIALLVTTGWIAFAAAVFCLWEDWSYFTSVYFFFISMSTIGFGDVTPAHPQYMIMSFIVVVVGLSLVSVCINVVQEKMSQIYMDFLSKMLQQYMRARDSGDVEALKGAMASFNQRCKYLMPLISKNQGIRLMSQFKEEARAMGVELPEVMTELSEETGKPAFCKIFDENSDERFNQFMERAQTQGKMRRTAGTQTRKPPMQKSHKFFISRADAEKEEFQVQTDWAYSTEIGTQTPISVLSDSGIQCCPSVQDVRAGDWSAMVVDSWTATLAPPTRNTGVQPDVSCILRIVDEGESDFAISDYEDEEADFSSSGLSALLNQQQSQQLLSGSSREGELERMLSVGSKRSLQMQRVAEVEVDEEGDEAMKSPLPPPMLTIQMASKAEPDEEEPTAEAQKQLMRKQRRGKMRAGLRYMRNTATQVGLSSAGTDFSCQIGCPSTEDKEVVTMDAKLGLREKWTQLPERTQTMNGHHIIGTRPSEEEEEASLSFETASDRRTSIGAQTQLQSRELLRSKRVQTDRIQLVNRPVQTQLTSTFRRAGQEEEDAMKEEESGIAAMEAQGQGGMEDVRRERADLKRLFGLDDQEIGLLREKMREMKKQPKGRRRGRDQAFGESPRGLSTSASISSSELEELTREDKLALVKEIRKLRTQMSSRRREEEEEEEEEEAEEGPSSIRKKRHCRDIPGGGFVMDEEPAREFTLQISQPATGGHIWRENYEETILDLQLIRSPFYETKFLPSSVEPLVFARAELACKKSPPKVGWEEEGEDDEQMVGQMDTLLAKLERLDTICSALGEESAADIHHGKLDSPSPRSLQIEQFTAESETQTTEGKEEAAALKPIAREEKWTQTGEEKQQIQQDPARARTLAKKVAKLWTAGKERLKSSSEELAKEETESVAIVTAAEQTAEHAGIVGIEKAELPAKTASAKPAKTVPLKKSPEEKLLDVVEVGGEVPKGIASRKLKGPKIGELVHKFEGSQQTPIGIESAKEVGEEMQLGTGEQTAEVQKPQETAPLLDIAQIVLVQSQAGTVEPMRIQRHQLPGEKEILGGGEEEELVPLSADELAQLAEMFPSLLVASRDEEKSAKAGQQMSKTAATTGGLQFVWQSSIAEGRGQQQIGAVQMEGGQIRLMEGLTAQQIGGIPVIPLANLLTAGYSQQLQPRERISPAAGMGRAEADRRRGSSPPGQLMPWPVAEGPSGVTGSGQLEFYRRWLDNLSNRVGQHSPLYDVPLRDISEFIRQKREELSQMELQKRQLERMAELASSGDRSARMVDLSIQTGVHSRVIQILGQELFECSSSSASGQENIDYLNNPAFSIARLPLQVPDENVEEADEGRNLKEQSKKKKTDMRDE